jgi:hypothetical protein
MRAPLPLSACVLPVLLLLSLSEAGAAAPCPAPSTRQPFTVTNPSNVTFPAGELVRLPACVAGVAPAAVGVVSAAAADTPVLVQLEQLLPLNPSNSTLTSAFLWVALPLPLLPGQAVNFSVATDGSIPPPTTTPPLVNASTQASFFLLSNSLVTARLAAGPNPSSLPAPFAGLAPTSGPLAGTFLGASALLNLSSILAAGWTCTGATSTLTASGPLFAAVNLTYTFTGPPTARTAPTTTASLSWEYRLLPGRRGPDVTERFTLPDSSGCADASLVIDVASSAAAAAPAGSSAPWSPTTQVAGKWFACNYTLPVDPWGALDEDPSAYIAPLAPNERLPNGVLGYLQPRWTQSCDARWTWAATDNATALAILVARPSKWTWAQGLNHDFYRMRRHMPTVVSDGPGLGAVSLPLRGSRWYQLLAGPTASVAGPGPGYALSVEATQSLDKLTNVYLLDWPGLPPPAPSPNGTFVPMVSEWVFQEGTNPTHTIRAQGRALLASLAAGTPPPPGLATLSSACVYCDPDWYGAYWGHFAPENSNFFTDFSVVCLGYAMAVAGGGHPTAGPFFAALARSLWDADLAHSITLVDGPPADSRSSEGGRSSSAAAAAASSPSPAALAGAGQESPGYTSHALDSWLAEAPLLARYVNYSDAPTHPRLLAAVDYLFRTSVPFPYHFAGPAAADPSSILGRWVLPLGDTHPTSTNLSSLSARSGLAWPDPTLWVSQEAPGLGAVLRSQSGTGNESYLAFKASPNRGHNHGDQLGVHYAAYGAALTIDIMAGYLPRPYEESWHNRLAFGLPATAGGPGAPFVPGGNGSVVNLDGYERLLAFFASDIADAAVGQVTSYRLAALPADPPPIFDAVYPVEEMGAGAGASAQQQQQQLTYRRTAVLVKSPGAAGAGGGSGARDYVLLVDAHNGSDVVGMGAMAGSDAYVPAYLNHVFFQQDGQVFAQLPPAVAPGGVAADCGNATLYVFAMGSAAVPVPLALVADRWNWPSEGNENATRVRAVPGDGGAGAVPTNTAVFFSILYPDGSTMPGGAEAGAERGNLRRHTGRGASSSVPTVSLTLPPDGDASMWALLTVTFPDGGGVDVLNVSGLLLDAGADPTGPGPFAAAPPSPALEDGGDGDSSTPLLTLSRNGGAPSPLLSPSDLSLGRSQGDIGLEVLSVGYTFGELPGWVLEQRAGRSGTDWSDEQVYPWPPNGAVNAAAGVGG